MDITTIAGIGIIGALLSLIVKQYKPEYALIVSICTGIIVLLALILSAQPVITLIKELADSVGGEIIYASVLLKALAICYITQLSADSCKDAGENAIANKVEMAGKLAILLISLPLFESITETIKNLII